jgi:8-oxo-dGTP diphosphatase
MTPIRVVCGIIWKTEKVFIAKRKIEKSQGGFWEFPGGKIENNENPESALIRELEEEIGMQVKIKGFFGSHIHKYETFSIELSAYECDFVSASFNLIDHDEVTFINPNELRNYKIAAADLLFVEKLAS